MNLGRRPEGYEGEYHRPPAPTAVAIDGYFNAPTDIGYGNIFISDGYGNSRVAKLNKNGDWVKSWGSHGTADGQFRTPHCLQVDRQGNVYVADRGNGRIQVFDSDGNYKKTIWLNAAYDKQRHPALGNIPRNAPNASAPWALCITTTGPAALRESARPADGEWLLERHAGLVAGRSSHRGGRSRLQSPRW